MLRLILIKYFVKNFRMKSFLSSDETTLRYANNQKWLRAAIENRHTIIDLGNPAAREFSAFYEMGKNILQI
jgi:hypothetical protein